MLTKKIEYCHNTSFSDFMSNSVQNSLFLKPVIDEEIKKIVSNFKNKQSFGYDGIKMPLVRSLISSTNIVQPLTYICNKSFESCIFRDEMKIAKIVPLFNCQEFFNYRPVSILKSSLKNVL